MAEPVRFTVWSDFLCPWCYVAALRLDELEREVGDVVTIEWRSFLLRPQAAARPLDKFTAYTQSWMRPNEAQPNAGFHVWSGANPPPSHSLPPAIAGKAVQDIFGADGFHRFHLALMRAYFADNRTISERDVILDVAAATDLDPHKLADALTDGEAEYEQRVVEDHRAALAEGIAAVASAVVNGEYLLQGAMTLEQYQKVVARIGG
jgi:predicted DsbA family dithiol-disulfide isomerase